MSEFSLPKGWIFAPIGDLCDLINGRAFKQTEWREKGLPIIRIQNLNKAHAMFNYFDGELEEKHLVNYGDLLFAWSGTPGTSFGAHEWRGEQGALNQHIFKLVFEAKHIEKSFFLHSINFKLNELIGNANGGVGLRHVTKGVFESTLLEYPPLAEQQQIAQKLNELLAQVGTLKSRLDAIPKILKRFRQSVLAAAVSGRLTEEWRGLNKMPLWRNSTLGKEFKCIDGDRGPNYPKKEEYLSKGHCLFLSTKNVRNYGFDFSDVVFIGKDRHEKLRNGTLERGDLVLTTRGTLGYVTSYDDTVPFDVVRINSGMLILRKADSSHVNEFFKMLIASPLFQRIIDEQRTGSAQPQLPAKILKEFELQIPSSKEQTEIVRRVEQLFAYSDQIEQRVKDAQARVNHLNQSILAKAFRGELTAEWRAQNPDLISGENSAAALLERIKAEREATAKPKKKVKV